MNTNLPPQLQKQVADANALIEQLHAPVSTESNADESQTPAPAADAVSQTAEQVTTPAASNEGQAERVETPQDDENSPTFAQRWRSLQGTYNVTKSQLSEAAQRIANLEHLVSSMQTATAAAPAAPAAAAKPQLTPEDATEYGADMVDFVRRAARDETAPIAQALLSIQRQLDSLQSMAPVVQRVAESQAQTAEERFFGRLTARVADWPQVNDNPEFHAWLMTPDPMTGIMPQTYLVDAQKAFDVDRVVSIFNTWKRNAGVKQIQPAAAPAAAGAADKLAKQVAPGRAAAGSPAPVAKQAKQYTRADIAKFYADKLRGVYDSRKAEADAIEADIFLAQREGRVVQNAA